jgi:hypothetical protein
MPKTKSDKIITRRSFAVGAAMAATATLLPGAAHGESAAAPPAQSDAASKLSAGARAEVDTKVKEIFRKYGNRLSEEQKADIRKVMAETQDGLEKMRGFALANGDQPATVLELYRGGERK